MLVCNSATASEKSGPNQVSAKLLDVNETAKLLGCSSRHIYRLSDAGAMPGPVRLGRLVRWRKTELMAWLDAGCPAVQGAEGGAK